MPRKTQTVGTRKLAAIMFTDMAGYTSLGQRNELLSLALVNEQRKLLRPIFRKHHGREIKTMGDAFLVEFQSALDGARCAAEVQKATREYNLSQAEGKQIILRIGLHVGDVIETKDGDISGDAVNIASRIEPLAEPGGVCLTRQVYDHIHNKLELDLQSVGMKSLKNVAQPIEVFKIILTSAAYSKVEREQGGKLDRLRLAVLPFSSLSPDPSDEYFADGITEELISTISHISGLRVISRTSVMQYKNLTTKTILEIGRDLKAGSIIEGSLRKAGNRIRIAVQLLEVQTDEHIWAETYDRELKDIFEIQSDIAQRVAESLKIQLLKSDRKQVERVTTSNTEAYTLYLKARFAWTERTHLGISKAREYLKAAIEKDPNFALAYSGLADCTIALFVYGALEQASAAKAKEDALKAVELDESLSEAHNSLAFFLSMDKQWNKARREFLRAIELNPNYVTAHHWYAQFLGMFGDPGEALEQAEKARQLDPLSPTTAVTFAMVYLYGGIPEKAIAELESYLQLNETYLPASLWLGICYIATGKFEEAISKLKPAVEGLSIAKHALAFAFAKTGRKEEALDVISEIASNAKNPYEYASLAATYHVLGMHEEHAKALKKTESKEDFRYVLYPWLFAEIRSDLSK